MTRGNADMMTPESGLDNTNQFQRRHTPFMQPEQTRPLQAADADEKMGLNLNDMNTNSLPKNDLMVLGHMQPLQAAAEDATRRLSPSASTDLPLDLPMPSASDTPVLAGLHSAVSRRGPRTRPHTGDHRKPGTRPSAKTSAKTASGGR